MSFHNQLMEKTTEAREAMLAVPIIGKALSGAISRADYIAFLGQAYHHVRHTSPLLMACGSRLPSRLEWLRAEMVHYIEEEVGHQEWILDDLEALGESRQQHVTSQPWHETELMVAYAYDTIARGNPLGFFGMVLVLEGSSAALASHAAEAIEKRLGLPRNAFSYLRSHGELDLEHTQFFARLMDRLIDPEDQKAVIHAANRFYRLYGDIFRAIDQRSTQLREAA